MSDQTPQPSPELFFETVDAYQRTAALKAAVAPGGVAVTLEFVPNEDRVSPPIPAAFSLMMLAGTPGGDAYTFPELERMFANAGFSQSELRELPASPQRVVISRK